MRDCNNIEFNNRLIATVAAVCYIVDVRNSEVFVKMGFVREVYYRCVLLYMFTSHLLHTSHPINTSIVGEML